jgi:hypothetical protein
MRDLPQEQDGEEDPGPGAQVASQETGPAADAFVPLPRGRRLEL